MSKIIYNSRITDYIIIGFEHILPKGLDHILFVLALFLLSTKFKPLFFQLTFFTIAHSITLFLGVLNIVNISPEIVEPIIAISIAYVAFENLFTNKLNKARPFVIFIFGLLHGLGCSTKKALGLVAKIAPNPIPTIANWISNPTCNPAIAGMAWRNP